MFLAFDPVFLFYSRIGAERDEILQICFFWTGLACIELFRKRKQRFFIGCAGFLFGLAFLSKLLFLGYFFGVVAALCFAGRKNLGILKSQFRFGKVEYLVFCFSFAVGCLPFLHLNFLSNPPFPTVRFLLKRLVSPGVRHNNLDFFSNLLERCQHLYDLVVLDGGMNLYLLLTAGIVVVLYSFLCRDNVFFNRYVFRSVFFVFFVCFCLSSFVPDGAYKEQMLIVYPIVSIIIASFIFLVAHMNRFCSRTRVLLMFAAAAVFLFSPAQLLLPRLGAEPYSRELQEQMKAVYSVAQYISKLPPGILVSNRPLALEALYVLLPDSHKPYIPVDDREGRIDTDRIVYALMLPPGLLKGDGSVHESWIGFIEGTRAEELNKVKIAEFYETPGAVPVKLYKVGKNIEND